LVFLTLPREIELKQLACRSTTSFDAFSRLEHHSTQLFVFTEQLQDFGVDISEVDVFTFLHIFPQQRKLMGSSAQNSSGVHWCRRWVRFNKVPEKVPKVPEKVWEALVQSQVRFNRVPEKVPEKVPAKVWEALVQSEVRFNRIPEKGPVKVWEALVPEKVWEALVQSQVKFNRVLEKVPEKVLGGFGAR